jgi:hypothetical protein
MRRKGRFIMRRQYEREHGGSWRQVTLAGTVDDRQTKREAESIAEGVSGVKDVSNQIRVRSEKDKHQEGTQNAFGNKHSIGENEKHAH